MTETENRFVIPLDFGYVLYHYNAKGSSYAYNFFIYKETN